MTDDERLERIEAANAYVPLGLYDEVTKLAEVALGEFIQERNEAQATVQRLREALQAIADEGSYLNEGTWHREPALIASLALTEEGE